MNLHLLFSAKPRALNGLKSWKRNFRLHSSKYRSPCRQNYEIEAISPLITSASTSRRKWCGLAKPSSASAADTEDASCSFRALKTGSRRTANSQKPTTT